MSLDALFWKHDNDSNLSALCCNHCCQIPFCSVLQKSDSSSRRLLEGGCKAGVFWYSPSLASFWIYVRTLEAVQFLQQINVKNIALIKQDSNSCVYSLNSLFSTPVQYYKGIMNTSSWWKSSVCLLKSLWAVFFEICIEYVSPNLLANWTLSVLWMTPFLLS